MPKLNTLNRRQQLFAQYISEGESQARAYLKAGFKANTIQQAGSNAIRLMRTERVASYLSKLKDLNFAKDALSISEKRSFIARVVRQDVTSASIPGDLIQEVREEVDQQGNVKRVVKLVNKLDALKEDNKMTNVYEDDKQVSNPFLFLVTLGRQSVEVLQQGEVMSKGERVECVALPAPAPATSVDAELVE
jgi:hypothetical protein